MSTTHHIKNDNYELLQAARANLHPAGPVVPCENRLRAQGPALRLAAMSAKVLGIPMRGSDTRFLTGPLTRPFGL